MVSDTDCLQCSSCVLATQNRFIMGDRESFHLYSTEEEVCWLSFFTLLRGRQTVTQIER